jgi:hypothetical protein
MTHPTPERARPIACLELKAALSAYVDDELTRDERLCADAHLVSCAPCRDLIERADTLREQFEADLAAASDELDAGSVDVRAMQANVLAVIGARPQRRWLPGLAIAAALAGAALATVVFWRAGAPGSGLQPLGPGQFASSGGPRRELAPVDAPGSAAVELASLDADDRQLLYSTGVILTNLKREGFERSSSATQLREVARYDELVDRLDSVLPKLAPEDRPAVALARDTILRFLDAASDQDRWQSMRRDLERTELDRRINALSDA